MAQIKLYGNKVRKLSRTAKQRKHLTRTMITQLVEHERIRTTLAKARNLLPLADRIVAYQNRESMHHKLKATNILTTDYAKKKLRMELAPRFSDKGGHFARVVEIGRRGGDKARMAYIEYVDNEIDKYEQAMKQQNLESGAVKDMKKWQKMTFEQERDFFISKLESTDNELTQFDADTEAQLLEGKMKVEDLQVQRGALEAQRDLFKKNLMRVEHDLFILNKTKYDTTKYTHIY